VETDFKAQVREDFANVLLNTAEFGRVCSWNGQPLQIAEDARSDLTAYQAQGVVRDDKVIFCRDIDLTPAPERGEQVKLDDEIWYVGDVKKPFGYLIIPLTRNRP
jgi:hypothetical protein